MRVFGWTNAELYISIFFFFLQAFIALSIPYWLLAKFAKNYALSLREKGLKNRKEKKES